MADAGFAFDNTYARLPPGFHAHVAPTPVAAPQLLRLNRGLAEELGLRPAYLESSEGVDVLAGNTLPQGAQPLAMAYAGFQFGNWVPQLGDGRAILLGELVDAAGVRRDLQLKGAGPTPFSRRGDGRAALGPVLREYLVSEAMAALGIPTTRALSAVATGEPVVREQLLPGAVLARVATSHVRVGTFQYFAGKRDAEALTTLVDYVIARHHPQLVGTEGPGLGLLAQTLELQAQLVARWQCIGFIHGVMNTDNMSIVGETLDYGPCAFMDGYDRATVFSSIDQHGRYAYGNQPPIAHWNLTGLARALLPTMGADLDAAIEQVNALLQGFPARVEALILQGLVAKLGLGEVRDGDAQLVDSLLDLMAAGRADFTLTFRRLCDAVESSPDGDDGHARCGDDSVGSLLGDPAAFDDWAKGFRHRARAEGLAAQDQAAAMRATNPAYIPRNHRIEEVIDAAVGEGDLGPFERLHAVLSAPYDEQPQHAAYAAPPKPHEVVQATFCGT